MNRRNILVGFFTTGVLAPLLPLLSGPGVPRSIRLARENPVESFPLGRHDKDCFLFDYAGYLQTWDFPAHPKWPYVQLLTVDPWDELSEKTQAFFHAEVRYAWQRLYLNTGDDVRCLA